MLNVYQQLLVSSLSLGVSVWLLLTIYRLVTEPLKVVKNFHIKDIPTEEEPKENKKTWKEKFEEAKQNNSEIRIISSPTYVHPKRRFPNYKNLNPKDLNISFTGLNHGFAHPQTDRDEVIISCIDSKRRIPLGRVKVRGELENKLKFKLIGVKKEGFTFRVDGEGFFATELISKEKLLFELLKESQYVEYEE